jgi:RNA polymerase sigma-70 factor (ECF subfamily)
VLAFDPDEQALLRRVTMHDEAAFAALYAHYVPQVRSYLNQRLDRPELIDDILQDVMLVLWQGAAKVPPSVPLVAWLCGVARHKMFNALARAAAPTVSQAAEEPREADEPEIALLRQDHGRALARELDALPHGERTAIKLLFQGFSYQDIATALDDPVSTVRTRVARACQRLRTRIAALEHRPS